ncbi:2OG-Fe(II) oxygenase [Pseudorhodoferax sp. LjRoot39]|uniref:2OG-Fe(II) oxygenase n=1 Tax=Pseudorhodoferax sp. LjRoot39 TaxID=3342328 RepID=UPI003ECE03B2
MDNPLSPILQALQDMPTASSALRGKTRRTAAPGFSAEGSLALDALAVEVRNVGPLAQPLDAASAQALHAACTPAPYGRRERTQVDKTVRDTGQIDADVLTLHWRKGALPRLLADAASRLGLGPLQAHAHKLLVYGPGQFFKPHQDTEKHPGMVATLVLVWPSAHIGGTLQVRHGDAQAQFASQHLQAGGLRWFAFYADCRHEVLPVSEGWRVVLTLDLVLQPTAPDAPPPQAHAPVVDALTRLFAPPADTRPWMFLLEHEYTEHGLRWGLLKGEDRLHVQALRAAAQALGLRMHLALAEIHESWTAVQQPGRRGRAEEPEADELIDEGMVLDFWVDADDQPRPGRTLAVPLDRAEGFADTGERYLVDEEYEGYMGNYGETLDFWYRRAALVLQTPAAVEASRFVTDFDAALADALALARRPGSGAALGRLLAAAMPTLRHACRAQGRALFQASVELACAVPDAAQARSLCEGFAWAALQPEDAPALARLEACRGTDWVLALLQEAWAPVPRASWWSHSDAASPGPTFWPAPLPAFLAACDAAGTTPALRAAMVSHGLALLVRSDGPVGKSSPREREGLLAARLAAVCELVQALQPWTTRATSLQLQLLAHVAQHPLLYPLRALAPLWKLLPRGRAAAPEIGSLRKAARQALEQALGRAEAGADDHSLDDFDIEWTCRCADCIPLIRWAASASAQPLALAMAEQRRTHVQQRLEAAAAPIGATTLREGSPYKLVLSKPKDLPARRARQRAAWQQALADL